ncbi:MAG: ribonuclease E/G, partial [Pseudomonadota bacterium]
EGEGRRRRRRRGRGGRAEGEGQRSEVDSDALGADEPDTVAAPSAEVETGAEAVPAADGEPRAPREPRERRERRDRGERGERREPREPREVSEPVAEVVADVADVTPVATEVAEPVPAAARAPVRVEPYVLAMDELQRIAETAGLAWVNSDADKIRAAQEAMAAEPRPVHVPRERPPLVVVDEGPLVLVETRKDLSQLNLPFDPQKQG